MFVNIFIVLVIIAIGAVLFSKAVSTSRRWKAMVTPLASIIGSGFLVVVPILKMTTGNYALVAMTAIVIFAYAIGSAIRFNIKYFEPLLETGEGGTILSTIEMISSGALAFAYVISITFYLELLAAFVFEGFGIDFLAGEKALTTFILIIIAIVGYTRGFDMLEHFEKLAVDLKIAIIGGLLGGLVWLNVEHVANGKWALSQHHTDFGIEELCILLGTILMVQGFETCRYIGAKYSPDERVKAMRNSQLFSGVIYVIFIALMTVLFSEEVGNSETAIIEFSGYIASVLPILLIGAAVAAQFSAAVADTVGAGGLFSELTRERVPSRVIYVGICAIAIILTWLIDVFGVIAFASRAFGLYYALQSFIALVMAYKNPGELKNNFWRVILFGVIFIICVIVVIFGASAEGHH